MYDELVKRLNVFRLKEDEYQFIPVYVSELITEAADAIEELSKRVPKAPHGRLIDADALDAGLKEMSEIEWNQKASPVSWAQAFDAFRDIIERDEPTIIPAEEGET